MAKRKANIRPARRAHGSSARASDANARKAQISAVEAALAGIAHDIRTPLTGIVALAELLASSDLGAREREWANAIKSGADHLAALSTMIIDAVKSDATVLVLVIEPLPRCIVAETVGRALAARASGKALKTKTKIASNLPAMVSGDALRLRAALENLADNAVKFTQTGTVRFTANAKLGHHNGVQL